MNRKIETPPTTKPKKERSPAIVAATAFNKIDTLRKACEAEIAKSPEEIRARYAERIARLKAEITGEAAAHLARLLGDSAPL